MMPVEEEEGFWMFDVKSLEFEKNKGVMNLSVTYPN
jgi:hypothetical protein